MSRTLSAAGSRSITYVIQTSRRRTESPLALLWTEALGAIERRKLISGELPKAAYPLHGARAAG